MDNLPLDEQNFSMAWRFNDNDCGLDKSDIEQILFLDKSQSSKLWQLLFDFNNLQLVTSQNNYYEILEVREAAFFEGHPFVFVDLFDSDEAIYFLWGMGSAAILSSNIFLKSWDDFFYPSDENSILYIPSKNEMVFSFNEKIFYAKLI